jgi:hypothetical protein
MTVMPDTIEQAISPAWLSEAIAERHPGTRVAAVDVVDVVNAVAARAFIGVTYEAGEGLPGRLFVKGGFAPDTAHLLAGGAYYREARFYRDLAGSLDVGMPACLHASFEEDSRQGVVVLEDLMAAGAELYRLGDAHDVDQARSFVDELAKLHGRSFRLMRERGDLSWIPGTSTVVPRLVKNDPLQLLTAHIAQERGQALPNRLRDPALILAMLLKLMKVADGETDFILHGDMHLGNIFSDAGGRAGWYDWQTIQRGSWAMDFAYYVTGALEPADLDLHRDDLLRRYLRRLAASGGPTIPFDDAFLSYRRYLAYGLFIWTAARASIVPVEITAKMVARFAQAADAVDTIGSFGD